MTKAKGAAPRITGEAREVPIGDLAPNSWNPNVQSDFKYEQTRKVIREFGFLDPCTVRSGRLKGKLFDKLEIIDGEHRWKAAKEEGLTTILVLDVGRMSDAQAATLTDIMNNLRGENDPMKWLEMVESIKATDEALLEYLPYKSDELAAMLESAQVDWDQFEKGNGKPPPTDADGKLFKKFSVSLTEAQHTRVADLMRKVKASRGLDDDAGAFGAILDGFEAHVASQARQSGDTAPTKTGRKATKRRRAVA